MDNKVNDNVTVTDKGTSCNECVDVIYNSLIPPVLYNRNGNISNVNLIPIGTQVLIKATGTSTELDLLSEDGAAKVALVMFVDGFGNDTGETLKLGDKVTMNSTDDFALHPVDVDGNKLSIVNQISKLKLDPVNGVASFITHDIARSKIALNHSAIIDPNTLRSVNDNNRILGAGTIQGNKPVLIVEYFLTHVDNIIGIYASVLKAKA